MPTLNFWRKSLGPSGLATEPCSRYSSQTARNCALCAGAALPLLSRLLIHACRCRSSAVCTFCSLAVLSTCCQLCSTGQADQPPSEPFRLLVLQCRMKLSSLELLFWRLWQE